MLTVQLHNVGVYASCIYDHIKTITVVVVYVFFQAEVSSKVENDVQFPIEVTGSQMRPVVVLEKHDLTR